MTSKAKPYGTEFGKMNISLYCICLGQILSIDLPINFTSRWIWMNWDLFVTIMASIPERSLKWGLKWWDSHKSPMWLSPSRLRGGTSKTSDVLARSRSGGCCGVARFFNLVSSSVFGHDGRALKDSQILIWNHTVISESKQHESHFRWKILSWFSTAWIGSSHARFSILGRPSAAWDGIIARMPVTCGSSQYEQLSRLVYFCNRLLIDETVVKLRFMSPRVIAVMLSPIDLIQSSECRRVCYSSALMKSIFVCLDTLDVSSLSGGDSDCDWLKPTKARCHQIMASSAIPRDENRHFPNGRHLENLEYRHPVGTRHKVISEDRNSPDLYFNESCILSASKGNISHTRLQVFMLRVLAMFKFPESC